MAGPPHHSVARAVVSIDLPSIGGQEPGPLFSIVGDERGNVYYSDEINHAVVSLDSSGNLRWMKGKSGPAAERFRYPRGMSLGWLSKSGAVEHLLAVCDSWRNRVLLLDSDGRVVQEWSEAGGLPFAEVSDVRFISAGTGASTGLAQPYWLVLDRGNHRLCALDSDGQTLFQAGRELSPNLAPSWRFSGTCSEGRGPESCLPFDPLFYPMRIFGNSEDNLYVWEPLSRCIRQFFMGNVFPVRLSSACEQWISAGSSGLLGWFSEPGRVVKYDLMGKLVQEIELPGLPVASENPPDTVWMRAGARITRYCLALHAESPRGVPSNISGSPMLRTTALGEIDRGVLKMVPAIDDCVRCAGEWPCLANAGLLLSREPSPDDAHLREVTAGREALAGKTDRAFDALAQASHDYCFGSAMLFLLVKRNQSDVPVPERTRQAMQNLALPLIESFPPLAECADDLFLAHDNVKSLPHDDPRHKCKVLLGRLHQDVDGLAKRLCARAEMYSNKGVLPGRGSGFVPFREIMQWELPAPNPGTPSRPYGIAVSRAGRLFVSLFATGAVLEMDSDGHIAGVAHIAESLKGPLGIAFDADSRLWIVDCLENRVLIWNPSDGSVRAIDPADSGIGPLSSPVGVCPWRNGSMLVADTGNHRIVSISGQGECRVLAGGEGKGSGEFRQPNSLCRASLEAGATWIVDHRNHRVQLVDSRGSCLRLLGKCGLRRGELYVPESIEQFPDGMLVVSQGHLNKCLKLFSQEGKEAGRINLDYSPGGMLVHNGRLLVTEFGGNSVRTYEPLWTSPEQPDAQ